MPWADEAKVREIGGLNNTSATGDWNIFRFDSNAELTTAIENAITVASAWIQLRILSGYYETTDANLQAVLAQAESYLALHFLLPAVKMRRVVGTHYPIETEGSDRYEELIDVEWMKLAEELLVGLLQIDVGNTKSYYRPTLRVGRVLDPLDYKSVEQQIEETLDHARSLGITLP